MSYQYISDFGRFFNSLYDSIGWATCDQNIEMAMELFSERSIQKEQDYLARAGFNIDLHEKVKVEIKSIFHKDNLETFRKLIPYIKTGSCINASNLIRFFNIDNKNLNYLLEYMIKHDTGWRRWHGNPCSLSYLMHRFEISLWDQGGIFIKAIESGVLVDECILMTFQLSDILKISSKNLDGEGIDYLFRKYGSKNKANKKLITHIFLDGKNKFYSLKDASVRDVFFRHSVFIFNFFDYDLDLIRNSMKNNGSFIKVLPDHIKKKIANNKNLFLSAGPQSAKFASKKILDDEETAMHFLETDPYSFKYLSSRLQNDHKFLIKYYNNKKNIETIQASTTNWWSRDVCFFGHDILNNKRFLKKHLKRAPNDYRFISERLKKDISILEIINPNLNPENLKYAGSNILNNRMLLLPIIKKFKYPFKWISKKLRDDYELCDIAVTRYGSFIQYASDRLKNDKDLALKAVSGSYSSYKYLSKNMKKDSDVITAAIQRNGKVCKYIPKEVRQNKKLWMDMIEKRTLPIRSIFFACHFTLRRDPDIYEKPLNQDPSLAGYYSEKILINFNFKNINKSSRQVIYNIVCAATGKEDIFFLAWAKKHILEF